MTEKFYVTLIYSKGSMNVGSLQEGCPGQPSPGPHTHHQSFILFNYLLNRIFQ